MQNNVADGKHPRMDDTGTEVTNFNEKENATYAGDKHGVASAPGVVCDVAKGTGENEMSAVRSNDSDGDAERCASMLGHNNLSDSVYLDSIYKMLTTLDGKVELLGQKMEKLRVMKDVMDNIVNSVTSHDLLKVDEPAPELLSSLFTLTSDDVTEESAVHLELAEISAMVEEIIYKFNEISIINLRIIRLMSGRINRAERVLRKKRKRMLKKIDKLGKSLGSVEGELKKRVENNKKLVMWLNEMSSAFGLDDIDVHNTRDVFTTILSIFDKYNKAQGANDKMCREMNDLMECRRKNEETLKMIECNESDGYDQLNLENVRMNERIAILNENISNLSERNQLLKGELVKLKSTGTRKSIVIEKQKRAIETLQKRISNPMNEAVDEVFKRLSYLKKEAQLTEDGVKRRLIMRDILVYKKVLGDIAPSGVR